MQGTAANRIKISRENLLIKGLNAFAVTNKANK
jgi:hypothetical protein